MAKLYTYGDKLVLEYEHEGVKKNYYHDVNPLIREVILKYGDKLHYSSSDEMLTIRFEEGSTMLAKFVSQTSLENTLMKKLREENINVIGRSSDFETKFGFNYINIMYGETYKNKYVLKITTSPDTEIGTRRTFGVVSYDVKKDEITLYPIVNYGLCPVRTFVRELTNFQKLKKKVDEKIAELESKEYYNSIIEAIYEGDLEFIREADYSGVLTKSSVNLNKFLEFAKMTATLSKEPSERHEIVKILEEHFIQF
jgi:hypothetical protein